MNGWPRARALTEAAPRSAGSHDLAGGTALVMFKSRQFSSKWAPTDAKQEGVWRNALEALGTENVRYRMMRTAGSSSAPINGLGEEDITFGYAQDWLHYKDARRDAREARKRRTSIMLVALALIATASS